jgi:hypothetical protein
MWKFWSMMEGKLYQIHHLPVRSVLKFREDRDSQEEVLIKSSYFKMDSEALKDSELLGKVKEA